MFFNANELDISQQFEEDSAELCCFLLFWLYFKSMIHSQISIHLSLRIGQPRGGIIQNNGIGTKRKIQINIKPVRIQTTYWLLIFV